MLLAACGGGGGGGGGGVGGGGGGGGGVTPIDPSTVTFVDHFVAEAKATLPYPQAWSRDVVPGEPDILAVFIEAAQGTNDPFLENVALVRAAGSNLRNASGVTNISQVSSTTVSIDGFTGQETVFDASVPGESIELRFMEISFQNDGEAFGLFYSALRSDFNRNADIIRHMAENMRVGQIIFDNLFLGSALETPGNTPVANDGNNFLVVSCRESSEFPYPAELIGQLVGPDRHKIGAEILIHAGVDTGNTGCDFTHPRITFDGTNFLVTYMTAVNDRRHIVAKRVSAGGVLLDNVPIDVSGDFPGAMFEPAAVYTGSQHLIVWHHDVSNDVNDQVLGAFVDPDGSVSSTFVVFDQLRDIYPDQFGNFLSRPEIALGPNQVMVALSPRFARDVRQPARPIYAQLLDLSGQPLLASPLLVRDDNGDNPRYVQVVSDGQSYFVTWIEGLLDEGTISSGVFGVYGRQITTGGQLVNGDATTTGLEIAPQVADLPKEDLNVAFANNQYYLVWCNTTFGTDLGVYGNKVSVDLSSITPITAISGTRDMTFNTSMPRVSHPALSFTQTAAFVTWPARDGFVDGWLLPGGYR